jgi:hypothetical protein
MTTRDMRLLRTNDTFDCEVITEVVQQATIKESPDGQKTIIPEVKKIFLKGILQKADTLNQNGRIYPLNILEREVRNYQKFIIENRALGECVPPGTEIYTRDGWKRIEDISDDEIIMTLNVDTNVMEPQKIDRKVVLDFNGNLYRFKIADTFDMCLTPSHKMLVWDHESNPLTVLASDLRDAILGKNNMSWLSDCNFCGNSCKDDIQNDDAPIDFQSIQHEEIPYSGKVYCVTVKNGTWLMRYNGKVCWTHNCDHPDSSVIELKNSSHVVREAYLEDKTVYGTVELLNTPSGKILQSLTDSHIKLGISSRGVGSVKKQGDYYVVQDDFQLICWDFVSEPSTPGAFMLPGGAFLPEGRRLSGREVSEVSDYFAENVANVGKFDSILSDILSYTKKG